MSKGGTEELNSPAKEVDKSDPEMMRRKSRVKLNLLRSMRPMVHVCATYLLRLLSQNDQVLIYIVKKFPH